ncbi:axoneme-associated protein mst101(2)-like isoform X2 [Hydra vulgaris]|uniref:Axoneme-associated protein mst101(2)-like isoform X2 n=1 Tax=Hydra vulgaris TaxID=6087 RepID=A0ABM4DN89_HYDVU
MKLFFKSRAKKHSEFLKGFGPKTESEVTLSFSEEISFKNDKNSEEFYSTSSLEKEKFLRADLNSSSKNGVDVSESDDDSFKSLNEKLKNTKYCVKKTPTLTPVQLVKEPKKKWTEKIKKKFQTKKKFSNKENMEHKEFSPNLLDVNSTPQPLSVSSTPQSLSDSICNESIEEDQSIFSKSDLLNDQEIIISDATLQNTGCTEKYTANDSITWLKNECTFDLTWENKKPSKSWEIKKPSKLNLVSEQPVQPIGLILYEDDVPMSTIKTLLNEKELKEKRQKELEYIDQEALNRDGIFVPKSSCQDLTFFPTTSNHLQSTTTSNHLQTSTNEIKLLSCSKKCLNESLQSKKITIPKANITFCKPNVTNIKETSFIESFSSEENECRQNQKVEIKTKYNYSGHSLQPINVDHVGGSNQKHTLFSPNLPACTKNNTLTQPYAMKTSNCNTNEHSQWVENKYSNISKYGQLKTSGNKKKVSFVESHKNVETSIPEVMNSSVLFCTPSENESLTQSTLLMENEFKPYASLDDLKNVVGAKSLQKNISNMDKSSLFSAYNLGKNIEKKDSPNFNAKDDLISLLNDKERVADEIMKLKCKTADLKKVAKERTADQKRIKKQELAKRHLEKKEVKKCEKVKKQNAQARAKLEMEIAKYAEEKLKADNKENEPELWEKSKLCDNQFKKSNDVQSNYNASDELLDKITDELINRLSFNQLIKEYKLLKTSLKDVHRKKIANIQTIYTLQKKTIEYEQAFRELLQKIQLLKKKHGYKEELFEIKKNIEIEKTKKRKEKKEKKFSINEFNVLNQSDPPSESRKNWINSILKKISVKDFVMKKQIKNFRKNKQLKNAKQERLEYNDGEHLFKSISESPLDNLSKRLKDARTLASFKLFQTIENHGFISPEKKISRVKKHSHKKRKPVKSHFQNSAFRRGKNSNNYITRLNSTQQKSRENNQKKKKKLTSKKIISKLMYDLESEKVGRTNAEKETVQLKKKCKKYYKNAVVLKQKLINEKKKLKLYKENKKSFNAQNQSKKLPIETPNYMSMAFDTIDKYIGKS